MTQQAAGAKGKGLMPVEEAVERLLAAAKPLAGSQSVPLAEARGRVLAADLVSPLDVPPHDNSAMDGYAVSTADLASSGETGLPVSQRVTAGTTGERLAPGTAARIFTGAPVPAGADAVIMQEKSRREGDSVVLAGPVAPGLNIRRAGEDIRRGAVVLAAGTRLTPAALGLAASLGLASLPVTRRGKVAILCTGDELVDPGAPLVPGQIYNSNRFTMLGLLQAMGCEVIDRGIVRDTYDATRAALAAAATEADLVLTSGGVSVGEEDHVRSVVTELGSLDLWKLNIKPGKPLAMGRIGATPFIGLPGNPVSVFVTFLILARPFLLRMMGATDLAPPLYRVAAGFDWPNPQQRREYLRVRLEQGATGPQLALYPHQGSGVLSSAAWADGLAIAREGTRFSTGEMIDYLPFDGLIG